MKKIIKTVLCLAPMVLLASCGKTLTKEEAAQFADENYSQEKAEEKYTGGKSKNVVKNAEFTGAFESMKDAFKDGEEDQEVAVLTGEAILSMGDNATFTLSGKSLTISYEQTAAEFLSQYGTSGLSSDGIEGSVKGTIKTTEEGLAASSSLKVDLNINISMGGLTLTGTMKFDMESTFTWSKENVA